MLQRSESWWGGGTSCGRWPRRWDHGSGRDQTRWNVWWITTPITSFGYRGYAADGRVLLLGRVLQDEGLLQPDPSHSKLRNLVAMLKRLESDPLPFARVRARLPGGDRELIADDEGFIRDWVTLDAPSEPGWRSSSPRAAHPAGGVSSAGRALYPHPSSLGCVRCHQRHGRHRAPVPRHRLHPGGAHGAAGERAHPAAISRRGGVLSRPTSRGAPAGRGIPSSTCRAVPGISTT